MLSPSSMSPAIAAAVAVAGPRVQTIFVREYLDEEGRGATSGVPEPQRVRANSLPRERAFRSSPAMSESNDF
jgi:hypothetical protein